MDIFREISIREANEYIRACLARGKTLSHYLLELCNLDNGSAVTYLPNDFDEIALNQFDIGGIIQKNTNLKKIMPETDLWLANRIHSFLTAGDSNICIFENALAKPNDQWLALRNTQIFTFQDEVYHYLLHRDTEKELIEKTIRDATTYLFIGIMSCVKDITPFQQHANVITASELKFFAEKTKKIFVGAYDSEGYLIWELETKR